MGQRQFRLLPLVLDGLPLMSALSLQKGRLRAEIMEKLAAAPPGGEAAFRARDHFLSAFSFNASRIISAYLPIRHEMDPRPLMAALAGCGHALCLPVMQGRGAPLLFRRYAFGDPLETRPFGLREPLENAPVLVPDVILCPLVAFDRRGRRLGHGAGCFDATLRALRRADHHVTAIGFAHARQEAPEVPAGENDEPLDAVITEDGVVRLTGQAPGGPL